MSIKQKQLMADYLNNISAGWLLLGVVTPFLAGIKFDQVALLKVIFSLLLSVIIIAGGMIIVKR